MAAIVCLLFFNFIIRKTSDDITEDGGSSLELSWYRKLETLQNRILRSQKSSCPFEH